ncbi:MAG TPA: virulence RhuM family protein [Candidatus Saccharibacteria bacterium]|nr:virulence RhuM family protein [Candidatus Saccharibacteria bacterium]
MVAGELPAPHEAEFLFYSGPDGRLQIEVYFAGETVWLTQAKMTELFDVDRTVIGKHIKNIFESGELDEESNVQKMHVAHSTKPVSYYSLDVIISVGYRVNSLQATAFRKWATTVLREYMIKGFALDDERLKNGAHFGKDYFDELLERIREIRLSERRIYLKVTDIFALASDYDRTSEIVKEFFAFIQNKLHYAVAGGTAAELIHARADKAKDHMGLETWKHAPHGKILRTDVTVAKNYLNKSELEQLQFVVSAFLDIAEARARRGVPTTMAKWIEVMNGYLDLNEYPQLQNAGKISKKQADKKALAEYAEFRIRQDREYVGDFEREAKKLEGGGND